MIKEKSILFTNTYERWIHDIHYINCIIKEQRFLKHLIYKYMVTTCNIPSSLRVLVYIHAGFGDRTERDYCFTLNSEKGYKTLIQTDDWNDIGSVLEFQKFFYSFNQESIIL